MEKSLYQLNRLVDPLHHWHGRRSDGISDQYLLHGASQSAFASWRAGYRERYYKLPDVLCRIWPLWGHRYTIFSGLWRQTVLSLRSHFEPRDDHPSYYFHAFGLASALLRFIFDFYEPRSRSRLNWAKLCCLDAPRHFHPDLVRNIDQVPLNIQYLLCVDDYPTHY